jgi:glucosamine kinase
MLGDEGSGYAIGRDALRAVLGAVDGRGDATRLLPELLDALSLTDPQGIPPWVGRAEKSRVASLATHVLRLAEQGDTVAERILLRAADNLVEHAVALFHRLGPWTASPAVVLHGGMTRQPLYAGYVRRALEKKIPCTSREPFADAIRGALDYANTLAAASMPAA